MCKNYNTELIQLPIDVFKIINKYIQIEHSDEIPSFKGYFYDHTKNKKDLYEQHICHIINEIAKQKKNIFLLIDLENYCVYEDKYSCHSVMSFLKYDMTTGTYKMFYLNSHGQDIELYNWYYKILSSRRLKEYSIKENMNIDKIVIMETFFRSYLLNECEYSIDINTFKWENNHVYLGENLQENDDTGICFTFPFVFLKYIVEGMRTSQFNHYFNITSFIRKHSRQIKHQDYSKKYLKEVVYAFNEFVGKQITQNHY